MANRQGIFPYRLLGVFGIASILALHSCSMKQEILLKPDGSGTSTFSALMDEGFIKRIRSLQEMGSGAKTDPSQPFFQTQSIKNQIARNSELTLNYLSLSGTNGVKGEVAFTDFSKAFSFSSKELESTKAFSLTRSGKVATFKFSVSRSNAAALLDMFPGIDKDLLETLSPPALDPEPLSESEYLEMLSGIFGTKLVPAIKSASYELTVSPNGKISSQKGGTIKGNSVVFIVPFLKLLVLEKPIDLMVTWKEY